MSCLQVTACHLSVNLGVPSVRFRNIYHSSRAPSMLCVSPTHINRFPKISQKMASRISAYRQRAPVCLFGGKGKSEDTNDDAPWKAFEKARESSKKEPPVEELFKQQMAKEEYYDDDGGSGNDDGGGSGGRNSRGRGSGDVSGDSGDEVLQATLATIGLICVYIYILRGEEITQVAKDFVRFLFTRQKSIRLERVMEKLGDFFQRGKEEEDEFDEVEDVDRLFERATRAANLGLKPKKIKSSETEDGEEVKVMSSSESESEVEDKDKLELGSLSEVEDEEEDEDVQERKSFSEEEEEDFEAIRRSSREVEAEVDGDAEEDEEELSLIRAFLDTPKFEAISKMYPTVLEFLSEVDDGEEEIDRLLRSLPEDADDEVIEQVLRSVPNVEAEFESVFRSFLNVDDKELERILRSFPEVENEELELKREGEDKEFGPILRSSFSELPDVDIKPNMEDEEEEERFLRSFLKLQDAEFDRVLRSCPGMEDEDDDNDEELILSSYKDEDEQEPSEKEERDPSEEEKRILRSYQEEEESILRSLQELEEQEPLSEDEDEDEEQELSEEDEQIRRSYQELVEEYKRMAKSYVGKDEVEAALKAVQEEEDKSDSEF